LIRKAVNVKRVLLGNGGPGDEETFGWNFVAINIFASELY
jgi:hypothetical protein